MRVAIYPGSFDPLTFGHVNIIERGLAVFDKLIVAIAVNVRKTPLFSPAERADMIREAVQRFGAETAKRVEVDTFQGLLMDYARNKNAQAILRGLRAVSDFEFEFQMAHMNRRLEPSIETVFMMTGAEHFYVSSQIVREVASFKGKLEGLVPIHVEKKLRERFNS